MLNGSTIRLVWGWVGGRNKVKRPFRKYYWKGVQAFCFFAGDIWVPNSKDWQNVSVPFWGWAESRCPPPPPLTLFFSKTPLCVFYGLIWAISVFYIGIWKILDAPQPFGILAKSGSPPYDKWKIPGACPPPRKNLHVPPYLLFLKGSHNVIHFVSYRQHLFSKLGYTLPHGHMTVL